MKPNGRLYVPGDVLRRPKLALTLRRIANDPISFYSGSLADDIVADIHERGKFFKIRLNAGSDQLMLSR